MKAWLKGGLIGSLIYIFLYFLLFHLTSQIPSLLTAFPFGFLIVILSAMFMVILFPLGLIGGGAAFSTNENFILYLIASIFNGFVIGAIIGVIIGWIIKKKTRNGKVKK